MTPILQSVPPGLALALTQYPGLLSEPPDVAEFGVPRSVHWETVRLNYVKAHPDCEACGVSGIDVHHVLPFHLQPALELDVANLIGLCRVHHFVFGHFMNWRAYNPAVWAFVREYRKAFNARPFALVTG